MGTHPKQLLVEDTDTKGIVIHLMKYHIAWGHNENEWPVCIKSMNSRNEVLDKKNLKNTLKQSGITHCGLIVDSDNDFDSCLKKVKDTCSYLNINIPEKFTEEGLILNIDSPSANKNNINPVQFGIWIMPDNKSTGMIETFCKTLVPDPTDALWHFAQDCTKKAQEKGAQYKNVHLDKAYIHTWLSWQDPPGERMGIAITKKLLNHNSQIAGKFVDWFKRLFECDHLQTNQ